ncbi:MAG TPA: hypothetical protein PK992_03575 [Planctomycetaceae bacterium]|nr:hypothetical protein [Planctomycetaceae bacterium]
MNFLDCRLLIIGLLFSAVGCGSGADEPEKYEVSGKVTMAGTAVADGLIRFVPGAGQPPRDPDVAVIKEGAYKAMVTEGAKRVEIEAYTLTGPEFDGKPTSEQVVPPQYNAQSTLTADIKPDKNEGIDFTLE